ncbi:hypothetical protein [Vibrio crassostreae]|uniref:hypothetical protein n=1 Tax=Vibrio crassostreae TaxID=246167 RepID=UPI001B306DA6|nr:hypothetical protein [Vibrio crassostreae]
MAEQKEKYVAFAPKKGFLYFTRGHTYNIEQAARFTETKGAELMLSDGLRLIKLSAIEQLDWDGVIDKFKTTMQTWTGKDFTEFVNTHLGMNLEYLGDSLWTPHGSDTATNLMDFSELLDAVEGVLSGLKVSQVIDVFNIFSDDELIHVCADDFLFVKQGSDFAPEQPAEG